MQSHLVIWGDAQEDERGGEGTSTAVRRAQLSCLVGPEPQKPFLTPRRKFKICLYCKTNPVDAMDFDAQRKMTFSMQLTFRDRKGSNLQSGNLQLWALFILLTRLNFRVKFQHPTLRESLEMS